MPIGDAYVCIYQAKRKSDGKVPRIRSNANRCNIQLYSWMSGGGSELASHVWTAFRMIGSILLHFPSSCRTIPSFAGPMTMGVLEGVSIQVAGIDVLISRCVDELHLILETRHTLRLLVATGYPPLCRYLSTTTTLDERSYKEVLTQCIQQQLNTVTTQSSSRRRLGPNPKAQATLGPPPAARSGPYL